MIDGFLSYVLKFFIYVFLQVLVLNNVLFLDSVNPYLYILFLIILPSYIGKINLLVIAFLLGLFVDVFSNTLGINACACVSAAYIRPYLIKAFGPRDEYEVIPSIKSYGMGMFIQYSLIMVLVHHFIFFFIESASVNSLLDVVIKTLCSTGFTMLLILCVEYFKSRK